MVPVHSSALFTSCPGRNAFEKPGENKGGGRSGLKPCAARESGAPGIAWGGRP
ncbi:hypothetical protein DES43_106142 [Aquamicrobium defluvii]|uniref:Uncharacterized protein n=1 Tax=Aquamicrobium defluvii TaxID=69279 RepID=A0A4R6YHP8_9HYPH|nr:hypothetical protein DES43_106142 [Aquamicrobium defluvii]